MTTIVLVTIFFKRLWIGMTPHNSHLTAPYRYPFRQSLEKETNTTTLVQQEIAFYQERVRQDPQGGLNLTSLARAYLKMGRATGEGSWYLLAEQAAGRSLTHLPFNNEGAILVLARVAEARHDFSGAIRLAQQVLNSQAHNEDALAIMVTSHLAIGKVAQASRAADTLVEQMPSLGSLALQALVKVAQGKDQEAIQAFQAALAAEEPGEKASSAWVRTLLGRFYLQRGQLALAEDLYQEALQILPGYSFALVQLGELKTRQGDYNNAANYYNQITAYSREAATVFDRVVERSKARLMLLQGRQNEAIALFWHQAEILLRQQNASGHHDGAFGHRRELAQLLLERGRNEDLPEALSLMQTELSLRRDPQTLDTFAWALSRSGRWREAQAAIQEALKSGVRDPVLFYRAGEIAKAQGKQSQAIAYFQLAQEIDPTFNEQARRALGMGL
ncbi:tetratricopeptide repeat protein [Chroococcidiopsis sp. TS-821]|uniref:tetratricopeptide repeat protein n=1 Tax=Chroococcidiopsis sp. TS-821 TaxID=1378066 RepID=UPI001AEFDA96|nr:tetratricopeptide repeat protein [Chroococcidiopsis sp. TS-821]